MNALNLEAVVAENEALRGEVETLQESMADYAYRFSEVQWLGVGQASQDWTLGSLKQVADPLGDVVRTNPLMTRAIALRHAYTYGDGVMLHDTVRAQTAIAKQSNQDAFFSSQAALTRLSTRAAEGNLFYLVNRSTRQIIHMPLSQVTSIITDDMDPSVILFVKRQWAVAGGAAKQEWFRAHTNPKPRSTVPAGLHGDHPLNGEWIVVHRAYNRIAGNALGVPDAMAVAKWADAYSEYLTNQSRLVRAYSRIAGRVMQKTTRVGNEVAAQLATSKQNGTFGHTVVGDFQHLPATGSQVSFDNGRAMAALVAAGLGVGVDALLSGTVGATKSVSDMLDLATSSVMKALQKDEKELTGIILGLIGAPNAVVDFPAFDHDPLYRRVASVSQATAQGLLFRSEARTILLDWLSIPNPEAGLPEPDGFNIGGKGIDPTPRQGHSGAVGSQVGTNNDARDDGEYDG